ncbi:helix-turn-helix domain-containing protein [Mycobacteroides abscessus]|uniref:helix-turn-helix domain-containing protein n=1 Tax=Mycobacteroides abscessus TaxID=36809 RepID=UPI0009D0E834|nr:helix-turn-helix transcriptional regulator [Mycobacteroides abscessus]SKU61850.1 Helix-turn-helix protein [Mycobacteroides abscessus subsp. massiliense]
MNLSVIRTAADMTQLELARILGVGQAAVSKVERQHDLLLSTLANYVQAAGAQARIIVTVGDQEIEYDLADFAQSSDTAEITQSLQESTAMSRNLTTDETLRLAARLGLQIYRTNENLTVGEAYKAALDQLADARATTREELLTESQEAVREYMTQVRKDPAAHGLFFDEHTDNQPEDESAGITVITGYPEHQIQEFVESGQRNSHRTRRLNRER